MVPVVIRCIRGCDPQTVGMVPAGASELGPEECSHGCKILCRTLTYPRPVVQTENNTNQPTGVLFILFIHVKDFRIKCYGLNSLFYWWWRSLNILSWIHIKLEHTMLPIILLMWWIIKFYIICLRKAPQSCDGLLPSHHWLAWSHFINTILY